MVGNKRAAEKKRERAAAFMGAVIELRTTVPVQGDSGLVAALDSDQVCIRKIGFFIFGRPRHNARALVARNLL